MSFTEVCTPASCMRMVNAKPAVRTVALLSLLCALTQGCAHIKLPTAEELNTKDHAYILQHYPSLGKSDINRLNDVFHRPCFLRYPVSSFIYSYGQPQSQTTCFLGLTGSISWDFQRNYLYVYYKRWVWDLFLVRRVELINFFPRYTEDELREMATEAQHSPNTEK